MRKAPTPESIDRQEMLAIGIVDSGRWFTRAKSLVLAAREVEPSVRAFWRLYHETENAWEKGALLLGPTTHLAYFMLMGFAAENYLKGLLVAANPDVIRGKALKGKNALVDALGRHNLVIVAQKAGLEMDPDETALLYRLTVNIEWFGRYPFALAGDDQMARRTFPDGTSNVVHLTEADLEPVQQLLDRLAKAAGEAAATTP